MQLLLKELKIDSVVAPDAVKQEVIAIVSADINAFVLGYNDIADTTLVEHWIEKGKSLPFRLRAHPIPYNGRRFLEEKL